MLSWILSLCFSHLVIELRSEVLPHVSNHHPELREECDNIKNMPIFIYPTLPYQFISAYSPLGVLF